MTEEILKNEILTLTTDICDFDVEVLSTDFEAFSVYEAKLGFLTEKLSIKKRQKVYKVIHDYLASIDDKVRLVGSIRHPNDFDMEIIVLSLEVNVCELER